ncbi:MAG: tetratricopeptide repeat protein [Planctomycetia bacterium]|nr:tetratricopeptide repeat protein [Planctomycetia bacterium]
MSVSGAAAPKQETTSSPDACLSSRSESFARRFGWVVLILAPLMAYGNSFHVPFVFDGFNYIVEQAWIGDIWSGEKSKVERFFIEARTRPLVYLSFALDFKTSQFVTKTFGIEPTSGHYLPVWHATGIAIHIIAGLALYGVARRGFAAACLGGRFANSSERVALVVALLWVVHPLNTQSITYLYQRHESLMGMFYLLTLYAFTRFADGSRLRWGWAIASVFACLCGMGAKEVMITAPFVVLWYDRTFVASAWGELLRNRGLYHLATFVTLGLLFFLMAFTWKDYPNAGILDTSRVTPQEYALTQLGVVRRYMQLAVLPVDLNIDYAWRMPVTWPASDRFPYIAPRPTKFEWERIVFPAIVVGGFGFLTLIALFRCPPLGFLAGSFFLILAPTSSIAPIIDLCFEHRMYLPLAPIVALIVVVGNAGLNALGGKFGLRETTGLIFKSVVVALLATALIGLTLRRNYDYRSQVALWEDATHKAPGNERAKYNFGVYLQIEGTPESMDRAIEQYYLTLKMEPNYTSAHFNLANIFLYRSKWADAERHYLEVLRIEPTHSEARYSLADTYYRQLRLDEARYYLDRLLIDEPTNANASALSAKVIELINRPVPTSTPTGSRPPPHPAP